MDQNLYTILYAMAQKINKYNTIIGDVTNSADLVKNALSSSITSPSGLLAYSGSGSETTMGTVSLKNTITALMEYEGTNISSNDNLNSYVTPGCYKCSEASIASTLDNKPFDDSGFKLYVIPIHATTNNKIHLLQIAITFRGRIFVRGTYEDKDKKYQFAPWYQMGPGIQRGTSVINKDDYLTAGAIYLQYES